MSNAKKASFLLIYVLMIIPLLGFALGGWYNFLMLSVIFLFIPVIDGIFDNDSNSGTADGKDLSQSAYFRWITYLYVPAQVLLISTAMYLVATQVLTWFEWIGFMLSVGIVTGASGITIAHELIHKNTFHQKTLGKTLLVSVCYGHFYVEHLRGHHANVGTPKDPATARFGESIYQFLPRTLYGSFISAWNLETERLKRTKLPVYSIQNNFWWIIGAPLIICIFSYVALSESAVLFFLGQSIVAFLLLEIVNYVEHYGLVRKQLDDGRYEPVKVIHAWNANQWLTNSLLINLQRHSDHHTHASNQYQVLNSIDESPQLPASYASMIMLALIPPLWFKIMDPEVLKYRQKTAKQVKQA